MKQRLVKYKYYLICALVIMLAIGAGTLTNKGYKAGMSQFWYTTVDSNKTYTSEWFDATPFDAESNIYLHAYYRCPGSLVDTLTKLVIEGRVLSGISDTETGYLIDTVDMVSADATDNGLSTGVNNILQGVIKHITLSPSAAYPEWRFKLIGGANTATFRCAIYTKATDVIPPRIYPFSQ